jgi:signal transduction histidine kinase
MARESHELFHERALAERVALVRLVLTLGDFAVLYADKTAASSSAVWCSILFFVFAVMAWLAVRFEWAPLDLYQLGSPLFDVGLASLLIVSTGGAESPFQLWYVFAIVGTGFSRYRALPVVTTLLAMLALWAYTQLPHAKPIDANVYFARSLYLFGVAAVIALLSSYLANLSQTVARVDETGRMLARALKETDAARVFLWQTASLLRLTYAKFTMTDGQVFEVGARMPYDTGYRRTFEVGSGDETVGELLGERAMPFGRQDDLLAQLMCERGAAALSRLSMAQELIDTAAHRERARIADELHDTYLQTLAALDLRAEAARQIAMRTDPELADDLQSIKRIAREAAAQARTVIQGATPPTEDGRSRLERVFEERWSGDSEIRMPSDLKLSDGQWTALEMFLREGLNNATKHGRASKVLFSLQRVGAKVIARLEDDGKGAGDVVALGYGLLRLRTLLSEQGGMLRLENSLGRGAALVAEIWIAERAG